MQNTDEIWRLVDAKKEPFEQLSDQVWDTPELCYTEFRSCAEHTALLERQGFRVTKNVAGIPTAVMGEAGEGGPVVAILGEYDALPGLGQESGVAEVKISIFDGTHYWDGTGFNSTTEVFLTATTSDNFANWSFNIASTGTFTVHAQITDHAGNMSIISGVVVVS